VALWRQDVRWRKADSVTTAVWGASATDLWEAEASGSLGTCAETQKCCRATTLEKQQRQNTSR